MNRYRYSIKSGNKVLGVIPARGGSKSIPKKNISKLNGKPLIFYTIEQAKKSSLLDKFIVSTDSKEIASIAKNYNVEVPFLRPKELSKDDTGSVDVVLHALNFMEKKDNTQYDFVVLLQPTNPLRSFALIDEAINIIKNNNIDSVVSIVDVGANHPHRMYSLNSKNQLKPFVKNLKNQMMPRQKLPSIYIRSGDIYVIKKNILIKKKSLIGDNTYGFVVDANETVNIDEKVDLDIARLKLKNFY